jgi:hypothetical protein
MDRKFFWEIWSPEQLGGKLPGLVLILDSNSEIIPIEYRDKNRSLIQSLADSPVSADQVRTGGRKSELIPFAYALDVCGRGAAKRGHVREGLELLHAAHEIFRYTVKVRTSREMRQVVQNALRIIFGIRREDIVKGATDAGIVREELHQFVVSAWGALPSQMVPEIDEMILDGLEEARRSQEDDANFHGRFVRENIEAVLGLEIPRRLEGIRKRWEEIGEHIAPNATRLAAMSFQRPEELDRLLPPEAWDAIRQSVEKGDIEALASALSESEAALEGNLRLRLDAKPEFRQPIGEVRFRGGPDRFFIEARDLLIKQDSRALRKFNNLHFNKNTNAIAKEWYAYALSAFGTATDIHEIIRLLEDAIESEYYRPDVNWTARWNLACALRRLQDRADEALDLLLPVLENDAHNSEVFELCLLWALEQRREDILSRLFLRSSYYEAHLLAALYAAEALGDSADSAFQEHFLRISRILRNPNHLFPEPKENLNFDDLDRLTRGFIETALVDAGIEWFRQRISYGQERSIFKNWECAARLNEEVGNFEASWRCRKQTWFLTQRNHRVEVRRKSSMLRSLLTWGGRHGYDDEALEVLRSGWRDAGFTEADFNLLEQRLNVTPSNKPETIKTSGEANQVASGDSTLTPIEAEELIQRFAASFGGISRPEALSDKANEAEQLLRAVILKHPAVSAEVVKSIISIVDLASRFQGKVPEEKADEWLDQLRLSMSIIRRERPRLPFELSGLVQACDRVIQSLAVRTNAIPEIVITPPGDLKLTYRNTSGERCSTRLFVRLFNPGPELMREIQVSFISTSPGVQLPMEAIVIPPLNPSERRIVECSLEIGPGLESDVNVRIIVNYEAGGFPRATHATGSIPVVFEEGDIPVRYVTGGPVSADRSDLFHGRDKELAFLSENFSGERMIKLLFVNGIRAVGKSTLMRHLGLKCGPDILALLLDVETALGSQGMNARQLVRQLCRLALREAQRVAGSDFSVDLPGNQAFELDPPWVVFDSFLEDLIASSGRRKILLCFDELQRLVKRIADPEDPMDDGFLGWIRDKIQVPSNTFVICTGSESFGLMRKRYDQHTVWRNMEPYDISFVDRSAMEKIAAIPVKRDSVFWLPEALDRLWDFTEGHPAIIQILAENAIRILNREGRRVVSPQDIERSANMVPADSAAREVWWNEKEGMINSTHRQIAFIILQNQSGSREGLAEDRLAELAQKAGIRTLGRYLDEMRALEVLTQAHGEEIQKWRVRGAFLEQHLTRILLRVIQESGGKVNANGGDPLALMLDLENVKIGLANILKEFPVAKSEDVKSRIQAYELASILLEAAAKHGSPRQRWAVADWDKPFFRGDQKIFKAARYSTDIAGNDKSNSSDHVLREKIHFVLREHPEIATFIIGTGDADFHETIKTLQEKGKSVVLWATRDSVNRVYGESLRGPDRIRIEWLEDIVFGAGGLTEVNKPIE